MQRNEKFFVHAPLSFVVQRVFGVQPFDRGQEIRDEAGSCGVLVVQRGSKPSALAIRPTSQLGDHVVARIRHKHRKLPLKLRELRCKRDVRRDNLRA
jgi:hypothetical protein